MRRARTVIGLPIISLAEGLRVGQVRDLVFDPDKRTVAALVVHDGTWRHDAELVPVEKIRSFGRDAITIFDMSGVAKARARRDLNRLFTSGVKLDGLLVMTEGGNYLGILEEIILGAHAEMLAYEISAGFAQDVNQGKCLLPANEALTVGRDVATFPDGVETLLTRQFTDLVPAEEHTPADVRLLHPVTQTSA
jgi:uncharacterized protein YrrD